VPDLTGARAADARERLERSRLVAGGQGREESDAAAGTVVRQAPVAGKRVPVGTAVGFSVATPVMVSVPELTGRSARDAHDLLVEQQLVLGESRTEESVAQRGSVIRQSPAAGARVPRGTAVAIAVAVAVPPPPARVVPPSPPPPSPDPRVPPQTPVATRPSTPTPPPAPPVAAKPPVVAKPTVAVQPPVVAKPPVVEKPPVVAKPPAVPEPAPVAVVVPSPATPDDRGWRFPIAWSAGTLLLLTGIGGVLYRSYGGRETHTPPPAPVPTFEFAPRWDAGTAQIGPAGSLSGGHGLRLVSGMDLAVAHLDTEHIVMDRRRLR